ncbi:MAG: DM13 domain-containing protein [Acidimicrobiales bacterium]
MGPQMAETLNPGPPPQAGFRRALSWLGLLALLASALFGGNAFGVRERFLGSETPEARPAAVSRGSLDTGSAATTPPPKETVLRSQPWWQGVTKLEGVGPTTAPLSIEAGAIQWRVKATCQSGSLLVRAAGQARQVLATSCPGTQTGYGTRTGALSLEVTADGPWQMEVDQQVDLPLYEPALPAMTAAGTVAVASGSFYRVDQVGTGTVTVYRLAAGGYALRLDDFFVTANTDLELQLSPLEAPRTTDEVINARSGSIAALDVTAGSLNFAVPGGIDPSSYRSLVIWCERTRNAYAAASLKPA